MINLIYLMITIIVWLSVTIINKHVNVFANQFYHRKQFKKRHMGCSKGNPSSYDGFI